jgi:hypothetical protein
MKVRMGFMVDWVLSWEHNEKNEAQASCWREGGWPSVRLKRSRRYDWPDILQQKKENKGFCVRQKFDPYSAGALFNQSYSRRGDVIVFPETAGAHPGKYAIIVIEPPEIPRFLCM